MSHRINHTFQSINHTYFGVKYNDNDKKKRNINNITSNRVYAVVENIDQKTFAKVKIGCNNNAAVSPTINKTIIHSQKQFLVNKTESNKEYRKYKLKLNLGDETPKIYAERKKNRTKRE